MPTVTGTAAGFVALRAARPRPPFIPRSVVAQITSRGWLESWWPRAVVTVTLLLALGLLAHTLVRHRRTRRLVAAIAVTVVAALLAAGVLVNDYAGYVPDSTAAERVIGLSQPPPGPPVPRPGSRTGGGTGTVQQYTVGAPALRVPPGPVWVYLPPGYFAAGNQRRYPVIYLMHGYSGRSVDWFAAGRIDTTMNLLIGSGVMPPAIVVAPDMNGGALQRDTEGLNITGGPQVQTYLTGTIPTWADSTFRTVASPAGRVVGGMSAGGYVALNLGLKYQDVFGGILAQEPYGDPGRSTLPSLGGSLSAFAAQSPSHYLPTMRFVRPEPTFIDVGSVGGALGTWRLASMLRSRGQPVYFRVEVGQGHTWTEARLGVAYGLVWVAQQLDWPALARSGPASA